MRTIPQQADYILTNILLQDAQLRSCGLNGAARYDAMIDGVRATLAMFQNEMLEAQREADEALAAALNAMGGK